MSKDKKYSKVVPELRFSEFEGEWQEAILEKFLIRKPEYGINAPAVPYSDKLPTYLRITDISTDGYYLKDKRVSVAKEVTEDNYLNEGDIVFARTGASVGKSYKYNITDGRLVFAGFLIRIKPNEKKISSELLFQFLSTEQYWRWVKFSSARSGQPGINGKQYASMPITLPPTLPEQQKIANTLTNLDDLIGAENEKLDALKAHKKGLLQQLFPAKGEKVPGLRFGEFEGAWEEKLVDDFFDVGSSKRVLQKDWTNKGIPFYRTRELVSLSKSEPFGSEIFISEELFSELSKKYGVPEIGDFLVSGVGTLGISYQVKAGDKFYFKDGNVIWFKTGKDIVPDYFNFCFQSQHYQKQIFGQSSASTVGTYTITNAKKTKFWKPPTKDEQQKIADCLSSLDDSITAQSEKIEALQAHKKGLMQQLFPNIK